MIETEESLGARAITVECATLLRLFTHKSIKTRGLYKDLKGSQFTSIQKKRFTIHR